MSKRADLDAWRLFFRIADLGSVSAVATELSVEPSSVSRRLSRLEADLGVTLMERRGKTLHLGRVGLEAMRRMRPVVEECDAIAVELAAGASGWSGLIRLVSPIGFAEETLIPLLAKFLKRHPGVRFDFDLQGKPEEHIHLNKSDIGFCYVPVISADLSCRPFLRHQFITCASQAYLDERGVPLHPSELVQHNIVSFATRKRGLSWCLMRGKESFSLNVPPTLRFNSALGVRNAVLSGAGICLYGPRDVYAKHLADGSIVELFPDWTIPEPTVYVVTAAGGPLPERIDGFVSWLAGELDTRLPTNWT